MQREKSTYPCKVGYYLVEQLVEISSWKAYQLLDIADKPKGRYSEEKAHEHLIEVMKKKGKAKATGFEQQGVNEQDWTHDMEFYIEQKGKREQHMEGVERGIWEVTTDLSITYFSGQSIDFQT